MQIDLRTVAIKPLRHTFDHLVERFGDKPASRYQEGTFDVQPSDNLHYRPTWDPEHELYDPARTPVVMKLSELARSFRIFRRARSCVCALLMSSSPVLVTASHKGTNVSQRARADRTASWLGRRFGECRRVVSRRCLYAA